MGNIWRVSSPPTNVVLHVIFENSSSYVLVCPVAMCPPGVKDSLTVVSHRSDCE